MAPPGRAAGAQICEKVVSQGAILTSRERVRAYDGAGDSEQVRTEMSASAIKRLAIVGEANDPIAAQAEAAGWQVRPAPGEPEPEELIAMKLSGLLVDLDALEEPWRYLEALSTALPEIGLVVWADRSTVAQRVRALRLGVDGWIAKGCDP